MKSKITKFIVACLALASFALMGCEPSKDAEGPVNITVKDADGNKYPTTKIGQQIWMAKNLNVNVEGSMCYDNNPANCKRYGRLYTWEVAKTACPSGWHLPSKEEFEVFLEAVKLRTEQIVTQKKLNAEPLKKGEDKFYNHLRDSSWEDGLNTFGFSALPAGYYTSDYKGSNLLGLNADFWSSTGGDSDYAYGLDIFYSSASVHYYYNKTDGHSVRCLKDSN
ncbi:MAG: hypothetical protein MJY87_10115 [Fibrobacter sp.]|nr:hypothetical protein [Fibrobacter sp.]